MMRKVVLQAAAQFGWLGHQKNLDLAHQLYQNWRVCLIEKRIKDGTEGFTQWTTHSCSPLDWLQ